MEKQTQRNNEIYEDEIDLKELFLTLYKNKFKIILITVLVTLVAIVYVSFKQPLYKTKALVEIGSYNSIIMNNDKEILLDNNNELAKKLNVIYVESKRELDSKAFVSSISVPKRQESFIEIETLGFSNNVAKDKIIQVIDFMKNSHKKILDDIKHQRTIEINNLAKQIENIKQKELKFFDKKISLLSNEITKYEKEISEIDRVISKLIETQPILASLKQSEKKSYLELLVNSRLEVIDLKSEKDKLKTQKLSELEEKKNYLESLLLPHNYKNTKVIGSIYENDNPVKPKKKLIVAVAFVTGFILSIFLVFFMEFIKGIREEKK